MKTRIIIAAAILALAACTRLPETGMVIDTDGDGQCVLNVNFSSGTATKSTGQTKADEDAINNVTLFVFRNETGYKLDASSYTAVTPAATQAGSGTPYTASLKCTVGAKKIYVVVNAASDLTASVACEADLLACTTNLKDNGTSSFFMLGSTEVTVSGAQYNVHIPVYRFVSSVRLEKITNLMEAKAYQADGKFVVNNIYLTNVVGKTRFDKTTLPSALSSEFWLARLKGENNALIYDSGVNATVNYGTDKCYKTTHTFYAYPNDCEASENSVWTQRATMLVIEATLDGVKYYYPVAVRPLESNRQYVITNFIIRRPGSNNPWEEVHTSTASIEIEVAPWGEQITTEEDI